MPPYINGQPKVWYHGSITLQHRRDYLICLARSSDLFSQGAVAIHHNQDAQYYRDLLDNKTDGQLQLKLEDRQPPQGALAGALQDDAELAGVDTPMAHTAPVSPNAGVHATGNCHDMVEDSEEQYEFDDMVEDSEEQSEFGDMEEDSGERSELKSGHSSWTPGRAESPKDLEDCGAAAHSEEPGSLPQHGADGQGAPETDRDGQPDAGADAAAVPIAAGPREGARLRHPGTIPHWGPLIPDLQRQQGVRTGRGAGQG